MNEWDIYFSELLTAIKGSGAILRLRHCSEALAAKRQERRSELRCATRLRTTRIQGHSTYENAGRQVGRRRFTIFDLPPLGMVAK
jgi:hypothetical protein